MLFARSCEIAVKQSVFSLVKGQLQTRHLSPPAR